ncbi:MAG: 3-deoxy-7-phosphoheptulonate synthase [Arenicella sp.]
MIKNTDDIRITSTQELLAPIKLLDMQPITETAATTTLTARAGIEAIMDRSDDRLLVIVGPCSIHDPESAMEYAGRLKALADELAEDLLIIMRVYFEKPRTTVGWKGLINDPDLNGSFNISKGLGMARQLLLDINDLGLAAGCEYLDLVTPQYISDLVSWGAIGARTTESQCHREMASGLSCPVGFKNGTEGNVKIAVDAVGAAKNSHHFMSITKDGRAAISTSKGNAYSHIILRGGGGEPNYSSEHIAAASKQLSDADLTPNVMIDFSHANSYKTPERQAEVATSVAEQVSSGNKDIFGVMMESHLVHGKQSVVAGETPVYGQSITDGCMGWEGTVPVLHELAQAVRKRRQ